MIGKLNSKSKWRPIICLLLALTVMVGSGAAFGKYMRDIDLDGFSLTVTTNDAPTLIVTTPTGGASDSPTYTNASPVAVSGTTSDKSGIASVTVNGEEIKVATGGAFSFDVDLAEGNNTITVVSTDNHGEATTVVRYVYYDVVEPTVEVTVPSTSADDSVTVSGDVADAGGIASVTVNGKEVAVGEDGKFGTSVGLTHGEENTITVVVTDNAGNTTTVTKTVDSIHAYDQEVASDDYLKSEATCVAKAVYYKSCECGEEGTETFEYGNVDAGNHVGETATTYTNLNGFNHTVATICKSCGETISSATEAHDLVGGACTKCDYEIAYTDFIVTADNRSQIGYTGEDCENLVIPETFQDTDGTWYKVVGIEGGEDTYFEGEDEILGAFQYCTGLTSVTIPNTIKSVGYHAFTGCTSLTSVNLSNGSTYIDDYAFSDCTSLTSVFGIDNVTYLGWYAFYNCTKLTNITIPSGLTEIWDGVFQNCESLTNIDIPGGVTSIGAYAFAGCSSLTSIEIPDSVASIDRWAFYGCYRLESIAIPASVTSIGDSAFPAPSSDYIDGADGKWYSVTTGIGYEPSAIPTGVADTYVAVKPYTDFIVTADNRDKVGYTGEEGENLVIPETFQDTDGTWYKVVGIDATAFNGCEGLSGVVIPDSVTFIGDYAFAYCYGLTSVDLGDGVQTIGGSAFEGCVSLARITIPDSVTTIGDYAFGDCEGLTSVVLGAGVQTIGGEAFAYCYCLEGVIIPDSVTTIGDYAFDGCCGLTSVDLGDGVQTIGVEAFRGCSGLTSVVIPDSVTSIGEGPFSYCEGLTSIVVDADNAVYHSDGNCIIETETDTLITGCKNSIIPDYVKAIGDCAFAGCSGLTDVVIPDGVTSIGYNAFDGCTNLTSVTIPDTVTSIGDWAFPTPDCWTIEGADGKWYSVTTGIGYAPDAIPVGVADTYTAGGIYKDFTITSSNRAEVGYTGEEGENLVIPETFQGTNGTWYKVVGIGKAAFYGCTKLTSIEIPASVTSIDVRVFQSCTGLTSIVVDADNAVYHSDGNCIIETETDTLITGCKNSVIPDYVKAIGDYAFNRCSGLTDITIPDSVTSIGEWAFAYCYGLTSVDLGDGVQTIGAGAFQGCTNLTSITIPDSITEIGEQMFYGCTSLTSVVISDGVTSIGVNAFYGCTKLTSIEIPASVTSIGLGAFPAPSSSYIDGADGKWYSVTTGIGYAPSAIPTGTADTYVAVKPITYTDFIVTADNRDKIGYTGEEGENLVIPETFQDADGTWYKVVGIGDYAFQYTGLTSVVIPNTVTSIGESAFEECYDLESVTLGSGVESIGDSVFAFCERLTRIEVDACNAVYHSDGDCLIETETDTLIAGCNNSVIPDYVTAIGDKAFNGCTTLESITIPDSVTSIGTCAFSCCTSLTSVDLGSGVQTIGGYAFEWCESLTSIIIPDSVTSIGDWAFQGCTGLTSVDLGSGVQTIGGWAFEGCTSLESITIPASVTSIGTGAFPTPSSDYIDGADGKWYSVTTGIGYEPSAIPTGTADTYVAVKPVAGLYDADNNLLASWDELVNDYGVDFGVRYYPAMNSNTLLSAIISNNTELQGATTLVVSEEYTTVCGYAFYNCTGLTSVTIPDGVTEIGNYAFQSCTSLESVTIPASVTSIDSAVFKNCSKLTSISVDANNAVYHSDGNCLIETASNTLVLGCKNSVIPDYVTSIGNYAFEGCSGLTGELVIPGSVTSIGDRAFADCTGLTGVLVFPDGVTSIGLQAFQNCSGLTSVTFGVGSQLTSIGANAFGICTKLESITIPGSVTSIGNYAFVECSGLTKIYYAGTEEQWTALMQTGEQGGTLDNATITYNYGG